MSDFFSSGWSWYVASLTLLGLLGCLWLLYIASRRTVMAEDNSTGHVFDEDLVEMNNPLPRWWMGLFILTVGLYMMRWVERSKSLRRRAEIFQFILEEI